MAENNTKINPIKKYNISHEYGNTKSSELKKNSGHSKPKWHHCACATGLVAYELYKDFPSFEIRMHGNRLLFILTIYGRLKAIEGDVKVMRRIFWWLYVAENFSLIKKCSILLKISEIII